MVLDENTQDGAAEAAVESDNTEAEASASSTPEGAELEVGSEGTAPEATEQSEDEERETI